MCLPADLRDRIVSEARTWLETPFRPQGRVRGRGTDCGGLALGVAASLGLRGFDVDRTYSLRSWANGRLLAVLRERMREVPLEPLRRGAVVLFASARRAIPLHMGILTGEGTVIHAWQEAGRVVESSLPGYWANALHSQFDFLTKDESHGEHSTPDCGCGNRRQ